MEPYPTSPERNPDPPKLNRWLQYIGETEETCEPQTPSAALHPPTSLPLSELGRLENVIAQLEVWSLAPVKCTYKARPLPRKLRKQSLRLRSGLVALCCAFLIGSVQCVRHSIQKGQLATNQATITTTRINPDKKDPDKLIIAASVEHLARALVISSENLRRLEEKLTHSEQELRKSNTPGLAPLLQLSATNETMTDAATRSRNVNISRITDKIPQDTNGTTLYRSESRRRKDLVSDDRVLSRGTKGQPSANTTVVGESPKGTVVYSPDNNTYYVVSSRGEWHAISNPRRDH